MVDEEVRDRRHVLAPGKEQAEHRGQEQGPLHGAAYVEEAEHEEEAHEGAHVDGAHGEGLVAPILLDARRIGLDAALLEGHLGLSGAVVELVVALEVFHSFAVNDGGGAAALVVGDEERERFVHAVAPRRDIVAVQAVGGFLRVLLGSGQFGLAAHRLLGIFIGVVDVGQVGRHAEHAGQGCHERSLEPVAPFPLDARLHAVGEHEEEHHEEEIVGHLQVVAHDLERREEGGHCPTPQVFPAVAEHEASDGRGNEGQGHHLPEVARSDDNQEVRRESPDDGTQCRQIGLEVEGPQENVEAQQVEKEEVDGGKPVGREEAEGIGGAGHGRGGAVGGSHLVGRHAAEDGVGPAGRFAVVRGAVLLLFLSEAHGGHAVVPSEHQSFAQGRKEVERAHEQEGTEHEQVGPGLCKDFFK